MRVPTAYERQLLKGWHSMRRQYQHVDRRVLELREAIQQYCRGRISREELEKAGEARSGDRVTWIEMEEAGW